MRADHSWAGRITAVVALAAASVLVALPASAHDELVGSDPAADAQLAQMPASIELTFSGELMQLGATVEVRDADGLDHALGDPEVAGTVVTVPVDPAAGDGGYSVVWRVVSSDGHAISGVVPFVVGAAAPIGETAAPVADTDRPDDNDDDRADAAAPASDDPAAGDPWAPGGWARLALVAAGGAAVALGLVVLGITLGRRRPRRADRKDSGDDPVGSTPTPHEQEQR